MYTYALRLEEYALVDRGVIEGQLVYRIRPEGLKRLTWLRAQLPAEIGNPLVRILRKIGL
jgi:hypothetical protein